MQKEMDRVESHKRFVQSTPFPKSMIPGASTAVSLPRRARSSLLFLPVSGPSHDLYVPEDVSEVRVRAPL